MYVALESRVSVVKWGMVISVLLHVLGAGNKVARSYSKNKPPCGENPGTIVNLKTTCTAMYLFKGPPIKGEKTIKQVSGIEMIGLKVF